ncbi:MAG: class I SAM-dependent rRNA methyltransferase [Desulfomonilia bacterium]|nr:class I SAM-dependent rRNA methyltransferase [Desulfomonilia bacterium]
MLIVKLKPGKDQPILNGNPWIFSGAVDKISEGQEGEFLCRVLNAKGQFLCQGMYNPFSQIAVRVLTLGKEPLDDSFLEERIRSAVKLRSACIPRETTCFRLINAEGDELPGLVVDLYGNVLVLQLSCPGMDAFKSRIVSILSTLYPDCTIHERSDTKARTAEGLRVQTGPLLGALPDGDLMVYERGIPFVVDVLTGDRTGFYLEHRRNRERLQSLSEDKDVLDLFSYTGSFSVCALKGGARRVVSVELSAPAQALLKKNSDINQIQPFTWRHIKDDVARFLSDERSTYDIVVCDLPVMGRDSAEYIKIHHLAMERLRSGGLLFSLARATSTLSHVDLLKVIWRAARNSTKRAKILEPLFQSPDFPILPSHPQGIQLLGYLVHIQ